MTIVDSCILLDIASNDSHTAKAVAALGARLAVGQVFAPDIVFAEVAYGYHDLKDVNSLFRGLKVRVAPLNRRALFRAAKAFEHFQIRNKRARVPPPNMSILPDFYVGALAEEEGIPLLTRDKKRKWRLDFPNLQVIYP